MPRHDEAHWYVELPGGWHGEREDESTLFNRDGGAGSLAVTLLCDKEPVTREVLMGLAASTLEEGHTASDIQSGALQGLYFFYEEEGTAWREWYLAAGKCVFFVSYDCPQGDESKEAAEIDAIVAGLTLQR